MTIAELLEKYINQLEEQGNELEMCLEAWRTYRVGENVEERYKMMIGLKKDLQDSFDRYIHLLETLEEVPSKVWCEVTKNIMYAQIMYDEIEASLKNHLAHKKVDKNETI